MHRVSATPDRTLLIVGFGAQVFALDRPSGQIRWEVPLGEQSNASEVELQIADGVVIAATYQELWFIDYLTGGVHARIPLAHAQDNPHRPVMLLDGELLYVSGHGAVSCYTNRGHLVWTQPFDKRKERFGALAAVALGLPGNIRQADDIGR